MKLFAIISVSCMLLLPGSSINLPKSALKKIEKSYNELWEGKSITAEKVTLSSGVKHKLSFTFKEGTLFKVKSGNEILAYLYLDKAPSKFDDFDFMVIYKKNDLSILQSKVLVYREDYGGEIASKRWLKQFFGKNYNHNFKIGDDIHGISGATISCNSASKGIKKLSLQIKELKDKGAL